jgi:hypothetical protein
VRVGAKGVVTTQVDWVRATFIGAIGGGIFWAVVIKLISYPIGDTSWQSRTALVAGAAIAIALVVSWALWRYPPGEWARTVAAALWIVPFLGVTFVAAMAIIGAPWGLLNG